MGSGRLSRDQSDPLVGKLLGGCLIKEPVGRGGMGTVYRASRQADRRSVAIKVLSPFMAADDAIVARFSREAGAASRVRHPNVIRMLGSSREEGLHFTIMDFVDGENLADLLKREGRISTGRAVWIAREVAKGLAALHAEGIIHRDVKPGNILIGKDGSVKVTDFGIARDVFALQRLTAPGDLLGTIGFAAPEQLQRSEVDARADLYSLGATLHYMLSGVRPPADPSNAPAPLGDDVPPALRELLNRLLSRDPASRPSDTSSIVPILSVFAVKPRSSVKSRILRASVAVVGGGLALAAGVLATSSRGPSFHPEPWSLVFPARGTTLLPGALFSIGTLLAFFAFIRGREKIGIGPRSLLGFSLLATSLICAYLAGAATGNHPWEAVGRALLSPTPASLLAMALALSAIGLFFGMRKSAARKRQAIAALFILSSLGAAMIASSAGSLVQAVDDLREAIARSGWTWVSFGLAVAGMLLASRHRGRLLMVLLAPLAVFVSVGMVYWATQGRGSPPLEDALAHPGGGVALAMLLALGARAVLDLGPYDPTSSVPNPDMDTTTTPATPIP